MESTTGNINRRIEPAIPMARFSIGEDDERPPATVKRPRLSESPSASQIPVHQSQPLVAAQEEDVELNGLIAVEDVESESDGYEEVEDDEDEESEAEEDDDEHIGSEDDNRNQQMTSSTAASLLRGLSNVAVAHRTENTVSPVCNDAVGELQVVITDPDVLDCPICLDPLSAPVFQCENGHIACSLCCSKVTQKCPSCCMPIGYNRCRAIEKVIESVKVSCRYAFSGCEKTMSYNQKTEHEKMCPLATCFCPHSSCPFAGTSKNLYLHFGIQHAASTTRFTYNTTFLVNVATHQKHIFLQEQHESVIFILNHQVKEHGRVFNIECVGPSTLKACLDYEIIARTRESSLSLECIPETYTRWSEHLLKKNYLTVPSDFFGCDGSHGTLALYIHISKVFSPV